jgi:hypothetical protein
MNFLSRPILLLLLLLNGLCACRQQKENPPIPEATMEAVLLDLHLAESLSLGLGDSVKNRFDKNYDTLTDFYHSVLQHHQLSLASFQDAMEWYKQRPGTIDTLYVKVLGRLTEEKAARGIRDLEAGSEENAPPPPPAPAMDAELKAELSQLKRDTTVK